MSEHLPYPEDQHEARVLCGDPVALAYEWIKGYSANLTDQVNRDGADDGYKGGEPVTIDELIDVGMSHIEESDRWSGDYITRGGTFEGTYTDPTFWDKLAALKGINIPQDKRNSFFSCSC